MVFLIGAPTALVLWYGGRQVIAGNLTIGGMVQFIMYLGMLAMPIRAFGAWSPTCIPARCQPANVFWKSSIRNPRSKINRMRSFWIN